MEHISNENFAEILEIFISKEKLTYKKVSKSIGCSEMTLRRLANKKTRPTEDMMKQVGIMIEISYKKYSKLSEIEKEKITELIGTLGGGAVGFASISAAVSILGTTAGLSAAGITSGLAAIGTIVGGGMIAGVTIAAAIPITAGLAGYGIVKAVKGGVDEIKVNMKNIDSKWEIGIDVEETNTKIE